MINSLPDAIVAIAAEVQSDGDLADVVTLKITRHPTEPGAVALESTWNQTLLELIAEVSTGR